MATTSYILDFLAELRRRTPEGPIPVDLSIEIPLTLRRRGRSSKAPLPDDLRGIRKRETVRAELGARYVRPPEAGPPKDGEPTAEGDVLVGMAVGKLWRGLGESCGLSCVRHRCTGCIYLAYKPVLRDGDVIRADQSIVDAWGNPLDEVRHAALAEYLPARREKREERKEGAKALANAWRVVAFEHVLRISALAAGDKAGKGFEWRAPARRRIDSAGG